MNDAAAATTILRPGVTLYFVRHGETDWNRDARYQGQRDIPLNDTGRAQAKRNGAALRAVVASNPAIDFVASPLIRAVETMRIMRAELDLPPEVFRLDDQLKELNYGHWEGQLATELSRLDPEGVAAKSRDPFVWRPCGGESYQDLQTRVARWLATLDRDVIAVSHGGVSRVARGAVLRISPRQTPFLDSPQDKVMVLRASGVDWF